MAYKTATDLNDFFSDLSARREFNSTDTTEFEFEKTSKQFNITKSQKFVKYFLNPHTPHKRMLLNWQTGSGKTIAAIEIAKQFVPHYKETYLAGISTPRITIISFTKLIVTDDMIKFPDFGIVSERELFELDNAKDETTKKLLINKYKRRIEDPEQGGFYSFYGYKEFANRLFVAKGSHSFDIKGLFNKKTENIEEKIKQLVNDGILTIDADIVKQLTDGLLICDEIHNVYNIMEQNNYGAAIKYILDTLKNNAPKCLFISATPLTGSAQSVVDLLNILVPSGHFTRSDFFEQSSVMSTDLDIEEYEDDEDDEIANFKVSKLKAGALKKIEHLCNGSVSYLLDSNTDMFPTRTFHGESYEGIPYIKIIKCEMSKYHRDTYTNMCETSNTVKISAVNYTLFDIAFPNPNGPHGLYNSKTMLRTVDEASDAWRTENQIKTNDKIFYGGICKLDKLKKYSTKYFKMVTDLLDIIKSKSSGKILIFHYRVKTSGALFIAEILKENGFIGTEATAHSTTICSECGIPYGTHESQKHQFTPARFTMAHSDIDKNDMDRAIKMFNVPSNKFGTEIKVLIGSKIIKESYNFNCVQHQIIMSLPTDYPTMIQVLGRTMRKGSHLWLPHDKNVINTYIYASTIDGEGPEIVRYKEKGEEFLVIQNVESAIRKNAIDLMCNADSINKKIQSVPSLEALDFSRTIPPAKGPLEEYSYIASGIYEDEVEYLINTCRYAFQLSYVWEIDVLFQYLVERKFEYASYNNKLLTREEFEYVINIMIETPYNGTQITKTKTFLIMNKVENSRVVCDIGMRPDDRPVKMQALNIEKYVNSVDRQALIMKNEILDFNAKYFSDRIPPELSLVECPAYVHYFILKSIIAGASTPILHGDYMMKLYKRFKVVLTHKDIKGADDYRKDTCPDTTIVAYFATEFIDVYNVSTGVWYKIQLQQVSRPVRNEDFKFVAFVRSPKDSDNEAPKLKYRPPNSHKETGKNVKRGMACISKPAKDIRHYILDLRKIASSRGINLGVGIDKIGLGGFLFGDGDDEVDPLYIDQFVEIQTVVPGENFTYASAIDSLNDKSQNYICQLLALNILAVEEFHRSRDLGRFLYIFNEVA